MRERKGFLGKLKNSVFDQGMAGAQIERDGSTSTWLAHRDGRLTNHENFKNNNPRRVFQIRKACATIEALALRGVGLLEMGVAGAGIARGIRHKSLPEVVFSAAVGGGAVALTEFGSEHFRVVVRSSEARKEKVEILNPRSISIPLEQPLRKPQ
jgi:hypothetical protein